MLPLFWNFLPTSSRPVSCSSSVKILQGVFLHVSPLSFLLFTHPLDSWQFSLVYLKFFFESTAPTFMASNPCRGINTLVFFCLFVCFFFFFFFYWSVPQKLKIFISPKLQPLSPYPYFFPLIHTLAMKLYPSRFQNFRVNFSLSKPLWILSTKLSPAVFHLSSLQSLQFKLVTSFGLLWFSLKLGRHCSLHSPDPSSVTFRVTFYFLSSYVIF